MTHEPHGRVVIVWPTASATPTALPAWGCALEDADTGEQLVDVVAMSLQIGSAKGLDGFIEAALTRLVDADGEPIGPAPAGRVTLTEEYLAWQQEHIVDADPTAVFPGEKFRTAVFRYIVAEMRIAASRPGVEPKASVGVRTGPTPGAMQLPPTVIRAWGNGEPTDQYGRAVAPGGEARGGVPVIVGDGGPPELAIPDGP